MPSYFQNEFSGKYAWFYIAKIRASYAWYQVTAMGVRFNVIKHALSWSKILRSKIVSHSMHEPAKKSNLPLSCIYLEWSWIERRNLKFFLSILNSLHRLLPRVSLFLCTEILSINLKGVPKYLLETHTCRVLSIFLFDLFLLKHENSPTKELTRSWK